MCMGMGMSSTCTWECHVCGSGIAWKRTNSCPPSSVPLLLNVGPHPQHNVDNSLLSASYHATPTHRLDGTHPHLGRELCESAEAALQGVGHLQCACAGRADHGQQRLQHTAKHGTACCLLNGLDTKLPWGEGRGGRQSRLVL